MTKVVSTFLQDIFIYPIKSLGGISLKSSLTEERGLPFDRRWLLVDHKNAFLTQRKHPNMALLKVFLRKDALEVQHINKTHPALKIPFWLSSMEKIHVTVFDDQIVATHLKNQEIEEWFTKAIGEAVKLIYMDESTKRLIDPDYAKNGEEVSFADGYPFMVTNQASLNDLNARLEQPVPMNRFRPNLVIAGAEPYEEDNWKQLTLGSAIFEVIKPCGRCKITTIDQNTAEKGQEPLITLSSYRRLNNKVIFGQNLILKKSGEVKVGDDVKIEYK